MDLEKFSFCDFDIIAKCIDVYDGDTLTAVSYFGPVFGMRKISVRLANIDCSEIKIKHAKTKKSSISSYFSRPTTRSFASPSLIETLAISAKEYLKSSVLNKEILIHCGENDTFGRILGDVFIEGAIRFEDAANFAELTHINKQLVDNGHAIFYNYGNDLRKNDQDALITPFNYAAIISHYTELAKNAVWPDYVQNKNLNILLL